MESKKPSNFMEFFQKDYRVENNDNIWDFLNQKSPGSHQKVPVT